MPRDGREPNCSLIIRNLADGASTDELREIFKEFGRIKDVYIPLDYHTRRQRGFAYVQFEDPRDADDAQKELDGTKYMDCEMRIDIARGDRKTPSEMKYKDRGGRYRDDRRDYGDRRSRRYDDDDDGYRRRDRTRSRSRNRRRRSRSRSNSRSVTRRRRESPKRERSNSRRSVSPAKTKSDQMGSKRDHSRHRDESCPRGNEQGQRSQRRESRSHSSRSRSRS